VRYMKFMVLLFLGYLPLMAFAEEGSSTYDRVSLGVSAGREVENDTLVALLYYQRQGRNTAEVADRVNRAIAWGVEQARQVEGVKIQTLDYQTYPVYEDGKLTGIWRVRQSLRLESRRVSTLSQLLGELQEKLAIQHIGYRLSDERRREAEDALTERAISRFRHKAMLVAQQFGASDFRIVSINISSSGSHGRPMPMMRVMGAMESKTAAAPVLEAGEQRVQVGIDGVVELVRE